MAVAVPWETSCFFLTVLSDVTSPQTVFQLLHHLLPAAPRSPRTGLRRQLPLKAGRCPRWCPLPAPRRPPGRRRRHHRPPAPRLDPNGPRRRPGSSLRRWQRSMWRKSWTSSSPPALRRRRVSVRVCRGRPLTAAPFICFVLFILLPLAFYALCDPLFMKVPP